MGAGFWGPNLLGRQFDPFLRMQTDMIRWLDEVWREAGTAWQPLQRLGALSAAPLFGLPPADVKETDGAYKLSVELPGLRREDVDLTLEGDMLMISGHKQEERQEAKAAYRLSERRFGRFERAFPLPPNVKREDIAAAFHDGVLTVTLPKHGASEPERKRAQIEIRG
jgi:HSP20 family protein